MRAHALWAALLVLIAASGRAAPGAGPDANLVAAAWRSVHACELRDYEHFASARLVQAWREWLLQARHEPVTDLADRASMAITRDQLATARLRREGSGDPLSAAIAVCEADDPAWRQALAQLRPGEPVWLSDHVGSTAYAPLLAEDGSWFGSGLYFVREAHGWRFEGEALSARVVTRPIAELLQTLGRRESDPRAKPGVLTEADCPPLPPPPEPDPDWSDAIDFPNAADSDESQVLRLVARRHAEGIRVPRSAAAQAIFAEVLLRSLEQPGLAEADARSRLAHARRHLRDAMPELVAAPSLARALRWAGDRAATQGDFVDALEWHEAAYSLDHASAALALAQLLSRPEAGAAVDCPRALQLIETYETPPQRDVEAARTLATCPMLAQQDHDAARRRLAQAEAEHSGYGSVADARRELACLQDPDQPCTRTWVGQTLHPSRDSLLWPPLPQRCP